MPNAGGAGKPRGTAQKSAAAPRAEALKHDPEKWDRFSEKILLH